MEEISTVGLDIAKSVFQVHCIKAGGEVVARRQLKRRQVMALHRTNSLSRRLEAIPGFRPLISTAIVANVPDPAAFRCGRDLSAWIGLVPKQNSSGGKEKLGSISKAGN